MKTGRMGKREREQRVPRNNQSRKTSLVRHRLRIIDVILSGKVNCGNAFSKRSAPRVARRIAQRRRPWVRRWRAFGTRRRTGNPKRWNYSELCSTIDSCLVLSPHYIIVVLLFRGVAHVWIIWLSGKRVYSTLNNDARTVKESELRFGSVGKCFFEPISLQ